MELRIENSKFKILDSRFFARFLSVIRFITPYVATGIGLYLHLKDSKDSKDSDDAKDYSFASFASLASSASFRASRVVSEVNYYSILIISRSLRTSCALSHVAAVSSTEG
jgi:hypothetical protein